MALDAPRRRRARPVADAPVDGLLASSEQIAKGWVLALLEDLPLQAAPGLVSDALARDAPRLCDAAARALAADSELARLGPEGPLRPLAASVAAMTGARGPAAAAGAVDVLSDVLWAALDRLLPAPEPALLTDLAQRLALVCACIRDAAIEGAGETPAAPVRARSATPAPSAEPAAGRPSDAAPPGDRAPAPIDARPAEELWAVTSPAAPAPAPAEPPAPLWTAALADEVRDAGDEGRPLSLLLAELEDAERVIAAATPESAGEAVAEFVSALRGALRRQDILICEADARAWVIARDTPRAGAHTLGAQIAEAVGDGVTLSGAPLVASIGIAVLGEDGDSGEQLIESAEEARFAASARGIEVSRRVP